MKTEKRTQGSVGEKLKIGMSQSATGDMLKLSKNAFETGMSIDIVFVLDVTNSMDPIIERCKELILDFDKYILKGISQMDRYCRQLRARLITYRDFYVEQNEYALDMSDFVLLVENDNLYADGQTFLKNKLDSIKASGGGDEPESGLEALAMAMSSDWNFDGDKQRHIIVMFTDAPAHEFELINECKREYPEGYPTGMLPESLTDMIAAFNSSSKYGFSMDDDPDSRRIVLFSPRVYPWDKLENEAQHCFLQKIDKGNGGKDLKIDTIVNQVLKSLK